MLRSVGAEVMVDRAQQHKDSIIFIIGKICTCVVCPSAHSGAIKSIRCPYPSSSTYSPDSGALLELRMVSKLSWKSVSPMISHLHPLEAGVIGIC